jgi:hypothetical protein
MVVGGNEETKKAKKGARSLGPYDADMRERSERLTKSINYSI